MQKMLYGIEDVCEATSLKRTKVCELVASGEIASVKVGTRRLVSDEALQRFVAELTAEGGSGGDAAP